MSTEKPPCPQYETDAELLKDLLEKLEQKRQDKAHRCLLYICINHIIPSLKRKYYKIESEVHDLVIDALAELIQKIKAQDRVRPLLWTISSRRIIDWIRKRTRTDKEGNITVVVRTDDNWDEFEDRYLGSTPLVDPEFELRYREFLPTLTDREREVLELLAQGYTEEQIASILGITVERVRNIKSDILKKYLKFFFGK